MRRREFIGLLGGAAAWPIAARAQARQDVRRIGVLGALAADDPRSQRQLFAFVQALQELGWSEGRNVRVDTRWATGDVDRARKSAVELVALGPDIILASGGMVVPALLQATRTVPVVFTLTPDPVSAGFVESLSRPGGSATGFTGFEYGISIKWLELLKEVAPRVTRVLVLRDPSVPQGIGQFAVLLTAAAPFGVELRPVDARDMDEIERLVTQFARSGNGGVIVTASGAAIVRRERLVALAALHKLPAVYFNRFFVEAGGLMSYGADDIEPHRRAAGYVDRILKGEKPGDLPVQAPSRYELSINLKTARALGIELPPILLARADEVIE